MFETYLKNLTEKKDTRSSLASMRDLLKIPDNAEKLKSEEGYSCDLISSFLKDDDPKTRKNAAAVMGLLGEEAFAAHLFEGYEREETLFVKSAYLEALCSYDYSAYEGELSERRKYLEEGHFDEESLKHVAAELKLLQKMTSGEELPHKKHIFKDPERPVNVIFTCPKELRPYLLKELLRVDENARPVFGGIMVKISDISKTAQKIRIYKEMVLPRNKMKSVTRSQIATAVCSDETMELFGLLHKDATYPFYFRVTSKDADVSDIASRIQALSGQRLVNSVSDYEAEFRLVKGKDGRYGIFLKLHTLKDKRFSYRKNTVATSMSSFNAAFTAYVAQKFMKENAQVLDPFCGVGTLLIERAKAVKAGYMYGIDTFGEAIEKARENSAKAGLKINYINRNYFDFTSDYIFDEIITEMPDTDRAEADDFYRRFFEKSDGLLKSDGVMIVVSCEMGLMRKYMRLMNYEMEALYPTGKKDDSRIFVIRKKTV